MNFSPAIGHEQKGYRPAVVISHTLHNENFGLILVCPISSKQKGYPFEVSFNANNVKGVVLSNQLRTVDFNTRKVKKIDKISNDVINEVLKKLKLVIS